MNVQEQISIGVHVDDMAKQSSDRWTPLSVAMTSDDSDYERFDAIFRSQYSTVRRYAQHRAMFGIDPDDVVAETFLVAWKRLNSVPDENAMPWLLGVASNVVRNQLRSRRRRIALSNRLAGPEPWVEPVRPSETALHVRRTLLALTRTDREVLILFAWDGLSAAEVSAVLNITPGAARLRLFRARKRFMQLFGASTHANPSGPASSTCPSAARTARSM